MGSSEISRQYLEQNTLRFHEAEYAAGGAANQAHAPQAASHPAVVFRRCRRRYMPNSFGVSLFREPDAGNPPVRFDEREQETEPR